MVKKEKKDIKRSFTFTAKDTEHEAIITWFNQQTNVTDSIRYLVEQEITNNGIRNLALNIPKEREFTGTQINNTSINSANDNKNGYEALLELMNLAKTINTQPSTLEEKPKKVKKSLPLTTTEYSPLNDTIDDDTDCWD